MIAIEEFLEITDALAAEIPGEMFEGLNGGVRILPECRINPHARNDDLVVLGEYHLRHMMGCHIILYYGSFMRSYGHLEREALTARMRKTLRHEFRHHLEYRSGIRDLEIEDREFLERYLKRYHKRE